MAPLAKSALTNKTRATTNSRITAEPSMNSNIVQRLSHINLLAWRSRAYAQLLKGGTVSDGVDAGTPASVVMVPPYCPGSRRLSIDIMEYGYEKEQSE